MSHHQTFKLCLAVAALALMLTGSESLCYGVTGCQPQTPCPCAADGVCRPKRESWGHYKTRWRSWPGELRDQQPTLTDSTTDGPEQALPPFEAPIPEQEDLRGPVKDKKKKNRREEADNGVDNRATDEPGQLLPGPEDLEDLPAFDPQGHQFDLPTLEDAPPALPESLRQAALSMNVPQFSARHQPRTTQALVHQASQQQPALGLINPASVIVLKPEANMLQQAIYYEASDQDDSAAE